MEAKQKLLLIIFKKKLRKKVQVKKQRLRILLNFISRYRNLKNLHQIVSQLNSTYISSIFPQARLLWSLEREEKWFESLWEKRNDPEYQAAWKTDLRMTGISFQNLVNLVSPRLQKQDTNFRKSIPIEKRVAIAIWRISTGNSFRTVSKTFAVGKSTSVIITREFCREITRISSQFIKFPKSRKETAKEIENFKVDYSCKIPQVVGAIDGTHIAIQAPMNDSKFDYYCRKQMYIV